MTEMAGTKTLHDHDNESEATEDQSAQALKNVVRDGEPIFKIKPAGVRPQKPVMIQCCIR
jgi:hypothetical protein